MAAEHRLVHNEGYKYKLCVQCQLNKVKTKKGWRVYTHFKCEKCNVALCRDQGSQKRNCFVLYHQYDCNDDFSSYYSNAQRVQSASSELSPSQMKWSSLTGNMSEISGLRMKQAESSPTMSGFRKSEPGNVSESPVLSRNEARSLELLGFTRNETGSLPVMSGPSRNDVETSPTKRLYIPTQSKESNIFMSRQFPFKFPPNT